MSFYFPSGLTLYIFTNTLLSSAHSLYMNKFDKKSRELSEMLKKNKKLVEEREKALEAEEASSKSTPAKKKNGAQKKRIIDAEAVETSSAETRGDGEHEDDEADAPVARRPQPPGRHVLAHGARSPALGPGGSCDGDRDC